MTSRKMAVSRTIATSEDGFPPRLAQEARVTELEALLARQPQGDDKVGDTIELAVERAALLGALTDRRQADGRAGRDKRRARPR